MALVCMFLTLIIKNKNAIKHAKPLIYMAFVNLFLYYFTSVCVVHSKDFVDFLKLSELQCM